MEHLAARVSALIEERDQGNVAAAARRVGVPYATLYALATNRRSNPSRETLELLAEAYGVTVDYLLRGDDTSGTSGRMSPADELIRVLDHPSGVRGVLDKRVSSSDLVRVAYSIAIDRGFSPEEMAKLDRWRDRTLTQSTPQPTRDGTHPADD